MAYWNTPGTQECYQRDRPIVPKHRQVPAPPPAEGYWEFDYESEQWVPRQPNEFELQKADIKEQRKVLKESDRTMLRLLLWLFQYVWPRLTAAEKAEVRSIIPDEQESRIKIALEKLNNQSAGGS